VLEFLPGARSGLTLVKDARQTMTAFAESILKSLGERHRAALAKLAGGAAS
jgi:hypothetical protein